MQNIELSVIIPVINEELNLLQLFPRLKNVLKKLVRNYEIIVVDGGSRDNSVLVSRNNGAKVILQKAKGFGSALREGFRAACGKYVVTMDGDLSHEPEYLIRLWNNRNKADVVIASRYTNNGSYKSSLLRAILSITLNKLFSFVLSVTIKDLSSGFRLYKKNVLDTIKLDSHDFEILLESILRVLSKGYRVYEVPFHYVGRKEGHSHVHFLRFAISYLKTLIKLYQLRRAPTFADYDAYAFSTKIFFQRWWQRRNHDIILDYLENRDSILDIGCGSSKIIMDLPQAVGVDININKLLYLKETNTELINADNNDLPFKNESFSNIICSEVIEHISGEKVFTEIKKVLKPGGTLILGTPDYTKPMWNFLERIYKIVQPKGYAHEHINHYSFLRLNKILSEQGFKISSYKYLFWSIVIIKAHKNSNF
jgi:dolichol-phosphate mannosyltransferase